MAWQAAVRHESIHSVRVNVIGNLGRGSSRTQLTDNSSLELLRPQGDPAQGTRLMLNVN